MRIIMHADLDSFYASAEEARKELKGRPIVVCMFSGRTEDSGAVATANYLARAAGIHAGMPIVNAKRMAEEKKLDAVFLPADMDYYRMLSSKIMDLMQIYADKFEQRSIDEAYMDVSSKVAYEKAAESANIIKGEIKNNFGITCSIGIGPNKLIAKMASRSKKPDGLTVIKPEDVKDFLFKLPAGKIFGVGTKTKEKLEGMGIRTVEDLSTKGLFELQETFGKKRGLFLYNASRGLDDRPVETVERQQISSIGTLKENTRNPETIKEKLYELAEELHGKLLKEKKNFRSVSVILITENLETHTKSMTLDAATNSLDAIKEKAVQLLDEFLKETPAVLRRCGVRVSSLDDKRHLSLKEF